jgi:hypothetical protein
MSLDHQIDDRTTFAAPANGPDMARASSREDLSPVPATGADVFADLGTLEHLAVLAAQHIPGAGGASVILGGADALENVGVSAPFVAELERLQQRLAEGPRIESERRSGTVLTGALSRDPRWSQLARELQDLDLGSALVLPLVTHQRVFGTLAVYGFGADVFDATAVQVATAFVAPAALAAQAALPSRSGAAASEQAGGHDAGVIERALGIMMSRSSCSQDRAILRLQKMSEAENQHLATMAQAVIDEALVESAASYTSVRAPHRPYGRSAPARDPQAEQVMPRRSGSIGSRSR